MSIKGLSIERLAEITDIPERFIKAIMDENISSLPSSPYIRGYLVRMAEALNLNGGELWEIYKEKLDIKTSGGKDKLPQNRFESKPFKKRNIIFIALAVVIVVFLVSKAGRLLGIPSIDINSPAIDNIIVTEPFIDLRGRVDTQDKLMINSEEVTADENGYFTKQFSLEPGLNSIEFKVKRLLGKETTVVRKVIYQQEIN